MSKIVKETFQKIFIKDFDYLKITKIDADATIEEACKVLIEKKQSVLIIDKENQQGLVTVSDLLKNLKWDDPNTYQKKISEIGCFNVLAINLESSLWDAITFICSKNIGHLPIMDSNKIIGMIDLFSILDIIVQTNSKFFNKLTPITNCFLEDIQHDEIEFYDLDKDSYDFIFTQSLNHVMSLINDYLIVDVNLAPSEIFSLMKSKKVKQAIVVEYGIKIIGVISENDFLKKVFYKNKFKIKTHDLMTNHPHRLRRGHILGNAIKNMNHYKYRSIALVNEDDFPLSNINTIDIFNYMINIW